MTLSPYSDSKTDHENVKDAQDSAEVGDKWLRTIDISGGDIIPMLRCYTNMGYRSRDLPILRQRCYGILSHLSFSTSEDEFIPIESVT